MKIIITGSTGMIGTEALLQCLQNPAITSIVALSRRDLPATISKSPKLKVIILQDFMVYGSDALEDMADAEACIW
jgi:nucleoside-diphosphate-sugar epimerase